MSVNFKLRGRIISTYGTQADFAQTVKEDETVVSRIIRGRRNLDQKRQKVWAKALNCKVSDIFGGVTE